MKTPAQSPDINVIENLWKHLGKKMQSDWDRTLRAKKHLPNCKDNPLFSKLNFCVTENAAGSHYKAVTAYMASPLLKLKTAFPKILLKKK